MTRLSLWRRGATGRQGIVGSVLVLMSWTIVAQVISAGSMVVLPRLFQPEQFGVFSLFSGAAVMLGIVCAGRYEFAIGLPKADADGAAVFSLCLALALTTSALMAACFVALPIGRTFPKLAPLEPWAPWVALGAMSIGWYNAAVYMALRSARYERVGRSKGAIAVVTAAGQVGAALIGLRSDGSLIVPLIVGQLCGALLLFWPLKDSKVFHWQPAAWATAARRFGRFPRYVAPASLLDGFAALLPLTVIALLHSPAQAGIFALAERTLRVPVTLIGTSVQQVFYKRVADLRNSPGASRALLLRTWFQMAAVAIVPCILIGWYGEGLFAWIFGEAWRASGQVATAMVFATFVYFVSYPTSNILVVRERVRSFLGWQLFQLTAIAGSLWIAERSGHSSLVAVTWCIAVAQVLGHLLSMALQWQAVAANQSVEEA